jgi:hypothetical protein
VYAPGDEFVGDVSMGLGVWLTAELASQVQRSPTGNDFIKAYGLTMLWVRVYMNMVYSQ